MPKPNKLADKIALSIATQGIIYPQTSARMNLLREMVHLSKSKNELFRLLNFEGEYQTRIDLDLNLGPCRILQAQTNCLEALEYYSPRLSLWEYDPFNWALLNSEDANWHSTIRAHHKFPKAFGPDECWLVWVHEFRGLVRYQVSGQVSALQQGFPDSYSLTAMRDAGLDVRALKSPRAIIKI